MTTKTALTASEWRTRQTLRSQNYIEYLCEPDLVSVTPAPAMVATFHLRRSDNSHGRTCGT